MDFSDPISMIEKGLAELKKNQQESYNRDLDLLARFEKAATWEGEAWTYWDFLSAPDQLATLKARKLSHADIRQNLEAWMAKDQRSKTALINAVEKGPAKDMEARVHDLVRNGSSPNEASLLKDTPLSYARYRGLEDVFDTLIELGAEGERAGFSKLHHAVRYGSKHEVKSLLGTFDVLWTYFDARSVLHEAVRRGDSSVVLLILDQIAAEGRLDHEEVEICFGIASSTGDQELVGVFIHYGLQSDYALDATLENYDVEMLELLLRKGADVHEITNLTAWHENPLKIRDKNGAPAIQAYISALLKYGWTIDDLDEYNREQCRYVTEAYLIPEQDIAAPGFLDAAEHCAGQSNPEERNHPYYLEMLRTGEYSCSARGRMRGLPYAVWTAARFGQSTTRLPDGRWVQIAGEHEDHYDRDFVIFSDVVLHTPGALPRIFFYPASVFPPTDFHTATLIGNVIWIIGGLGYSHNRKSGVTPRYRLEMDDFSSQPGDTTGAIPGWSQHHSASETEPGKITRSGGNVHGGKTPDKHTRFTLDTTSLTWTKVP